MASRASKRARIDLRVTVEQKELLEQAASAEHASLTEFVTRHATDAARAVVYGPVLFAVGEDAWQALQARLAEEPRRKPELERLFARPGVFGEPV
jgi:uncharacterized protein (DUF1778 family)